MLENLKVKRQYSRRQGNSVARMVLYECPVCGFDKHTELSRIMRGKGILHRRCAQGLRPKTLLVRESLTEIKCVKCAQVKPVSEFRINSQRGHYESRCKACEAGRQREQYLWNKYRLTPEDYDRLLAFQGGGCAICGAREPHQKAFSLPVDHCHKTGEVRGILCDFCNQAIGKLKDDPKLLARAIEYLEETPASQLSGLGKAG